MCFEAINILSPKVSYQRMEMVKARDIEDRIQDPYVGRILEKLALLYETMRRYDLNYTPMKELKRLRRELEYVRRKCTKLKEL